MVLLTRIIEELACDDALSNINRAEYSQPLCTAVQIALVDLLYHIGVHPMVVVGHSSGEVAAAYSIGALTRESAWEVAYHRGRLCEKMNEMNSYSEGAMLAVNISEQEAYEILQEYPNADVVIACINSPCNITLSGARADIESLEKALMQRDIFVRKLKVQHAYHSPHMELIAAEYLRSISHIKPCTKTGSKSPKMFSSVTGQEVTAEQLNPEYWVRNMVCQVKFSFVIQNMLRKSGTKRVLRRSGHSAVDIILEVGPHSALKGPLKQILESEKLDTLYFNMLSRGKDGLTTALESISNLFCYGIKLDILKANRLERLHKRSLTVLGDLPLYSWNRTHRFWYESRLSSDYRRRSHPRHHLLGAPTVDNNTMEPRWRNYLRVSESPWVRDHVVQSRVIYPGAGFIVMAIEAASQLADRSKILTGFELRDIQITRALQIPDEEDGVETMLHVRPWRTGSQATTSNWNEFVVYSHSPSLGWQDHVRGLIVTHYIEKRGALGNKKESELQKEIYRQGYREASTVCSSTVAADDFYNHLETTGMHFGPSFRNMRIIRYGHRISSCELRIPDTKVQMPAEFEYNHLIHPITLDNIFHMILPAKVGAGKSMKQAYVPVSIDSLYISANIENAPGSVITGYSTITSEDNSGFIADVTVSDSGWNDVAVIIKGLELKSLTSAPEGGSPDTVNSGAKKIVFHSVWKQDIDLLSQDEAIALFGAEQNSDVDERNMIRELEEAALVYMHRYLRTIDRSIIRNFSSHYQLFINWMQTQVDKSKGPNDFQGKASAEALIQRVKTASVDGRIMCQVGDHLDLILNGNLDPLEVLLHDNLLHDYYAEGLGLDRVYRQLSGYLDKLVHKYPDLTFLEIGAGTGGATLPVLQTLGGHKDQPARFQSYTFTDISSGFFENAEKKFEDWQGYVTYQKLNIEQDPEAQGFRKEGYDVIIAANVLHATKEMAKTMANVRKLLKPGGKLVMIEITQQLMRIPMIMGILPGWWLGEDDGRQGGPTLSATNWDILLKSQGYSGVDLRLADYSDTSNELFSVIISTVCRETASIPQRLPALIIGPTTRDSDILELTTNLKKDFCKIGLESSTRTLGDLPEDLSSSLSVILLELQDTILAKASKEEFEQIKKILLTSKGIIWVTKGGGINVSNPEANLIVGLARSIRAEHANMLLSTLDLDTVTGQSSALISRVVQLMLTKSADPHGHPRDYEFAEKNGSIFISRFQEHQSLNIIALLHRNGDSVMVPFRGSRTPLKLEIKSPGLLDTLEFTEDFTPSQPLGDDEVEIEVKATGVNFIDIMVSMGKVPGVLGNECAGVVTKVGRNVTRLNPGDRVWTGVLGAYKSYVRCHESLFQIIPSGMSYETAASLIVVYMTAYYSMFEIARMRHGESILIHAAAGGVGQAAIVLAKTINAEIFATVGSEKKKKLLMDQYNIPEDHIFNSRDLDFAKGVMRLTKNRGVDVVLNSLAGEALRLSFHCLAMYGRFIEIGKADILGNTGLDMSPFLRNVTFSSVNVALIIALDRHTTSRIFAEMAALLDKGVFKEIHPVTVYDYSEIEKVFRIMQSGAHVGKLILKPTEKSIVPVCRLYRIVNDLR